MNTAAATPEVIPTTPGTPFAGGLFCWRLFDAEGPYALIVAPHQGDLKPSAHAAAAKKAKALKLGGFNDWTLPNRAEALALFEHLRDPLADTDDAFEREWYWTSTQHADDPAYAWFQSFSIGYQHYYYDLCRARAVRRFRL